MYKYTIYLMILGVLQTTVIGFTNVMRYKFHIDLGPKNELCPKPGFKCNDTNVHYLCKAKDLCTSFRYIPMSGTIKNMFVSGHNGVRNKIAYLWNIANMNVVHWSHHLEKVAKSYLEKCSFEKDKCLTIGNDRLIINQNSLIRRNIPPRKYAGPIVRAWYLEIGYDIKSFQLFVKKSKEGKIENFTQMIWPTLEFIGCGSAFFSGSYFVVCFYYPSRLQEDYNSFYFGTPCSHCQTDRQICSQNFFGLCGLDLEEDTQTLIRPISLLGISCIAVFIIYYY